MKRDITIVSIGVFLLVVLQAFVLIGYQQFHNGSFLWVSGGWTLLTVLLYFAWKDERVGIALTLANVAMAGLTIAAYYRQESLSLYPILPFLGVGLLLFVAQGIAMRLIKDQYKWYTRMAWLCMIGVVYGVYVMLAKNTNWGSALIFLFVILCALNVSLRYYRKPPREDNVLDVWKLASMLLFGGILLAVVAILTDGDALEFFAYMGDSGANSRANQKRM